MNQCAFEFLHLDCSCGHPSCAIRLGMDEDGEIWVEFQSYRDKSFWRRLRNAIKVLFFKQPVNWSELCLNDEAATGMVRFLKKASPAVQKMLDNQEKADHGVY